MATNEILIPGDFLRRVFEHVTQTGRPLLRKRAAGDGYVIRAWNGSPEYDLTLEGGALDDDVMANIETWGAMADYLDMELEELYAEARKRGFGPEPWRLGEADDPASVILWDPHSVAGAMKDRLLGPHIDDLLEGLPRKFRWDPATPPPGDPPAADAKAWKAYDGALGGVAVTEERMGVVSEKVTWVPSAASLSCLQYVLDRLERGAWIRAMG